MHRLYILMRNDLESMNPGKAMAQASHASLLLAKDIKQTHSKGKTRSAYNAWLKEGNGFGTTLVLEANIEEIITALELAKNCGFVQNMVHDSTYPLVDGETIHYIPLDTCGYIFADSEDKWLNAILGDFPLHR